MADEQQQNIVPAAGFDGGYETDEVKVNAFSFGLNANNTTLTKFEWIGNGGKDGAPQEALDIIFMINGGEKKYRKFPITQAYGKNNEVITDPDSQEFKDAQKETKSCIVHILHVFVEDTIVKAALARPFSSFKEYCQVCASLLPANFKDIKLDIFLQYQFQLGKEATRTFLDIPKNMKHGAWIAKAQNETWSTLKVENPADDVGKALMYVTYKEEPVEGGEPKKVIDKTHRFTRTGWYIKSNFAKQINKQGGTSSTVSAVAATANTAAAGQQAATNDTW